MTLFNGRSVHSFRATLLASLAVLTLAACNTEIVDEEYDRSCEVDADCRPVFFGDVCSGDYGCFPCGNDAIGSANYSDYLDQRDAAAAGCLVTPTDCSTSFSVCSSESGRCDDGQCDLIAASF